MSVDPDLTLKLLRDLVAIDSVNPTLVPGARGEAAASQFLRNFLVDHGIPARLEDAAPGRPNVVALISPSALSPVPDGAKQSVALAILAHIDTVGAGDMPDPFTPIERDGRLFGRGALDIKSGVAAMCAAAIAASDAGAIEKPLLIAAVADEECNSIGTEALLQRYTANAAVVLEPTDLRLTIAHKGYAWFEIVTHGRAAHGSLPAEGRDAIRMMGRVLNVLDALDRKLASLEPHAILGHASLHASLIRGGQELSSYPAECRLELERRSLPRESAAKSKSNCAPSSPDLQRATRNFAPRFAASDHGRRSKFLQTLRSRSSLQPQFEKYSVPKRQASSREWLHGRTPRFSPPLVFPEWYSVPPAGDCTVERNTSNSIPSFSAARCCSKPSPRHAR